MATTSYEIKNVKTIDSLTQLNGINGNSLFIGSDGSNECKKITYSTLSGQLQNDIGGGSSGGDITILEARVASLNTSNTTNIQNISKLSGDVNTLQTNVDDVTEDVELLQESVDAHSGNITTLTNNLNSLSGRVEELGGGGGSDPGEPSTGDITPASTTELGGIKYWTYNSLDDRTLFNDTQCIPVIANCTYEDDGRYSPLTNIDSTLPYIQMTQNIYNRCLSPFVQTDIEERVGDLPSAVDIQIFTTQLNDALSTIDDFILSVDDIYDGLDAIDYVFNLSASLSELTDDDLLQLKALPEIREQLTTITSDISNLKTSVETLNSQFTRLEERVRALEDTQSTPPDSTS